MANRIHVLVFLPDAVRAPIYRAIEDGVFDLDNELQSGYVFSLSGTGKFDLALQFAADEQPAVIVVGEADLLHHALRLSREAPKSRVVAIGVGELLDAETVALQHELKQLVAAVAWGAKADLAPAAVWAAATVP